MQKVTAFFESVKLELEKVTWPTRKETFATTGDDLVVGGPEGGLFSLRSLRYKFA